MSHECYDRPIRTDNLPLRAAAAVLFAVAVLFAGSPVNPAGLRLMPWPAKVSVQPGAIAIDGNFAVSVSGAGASDPRVQDAVQRLFKNLNGETGLLLLPQVVSQGKDATLRIVVEEKDHPAPQLLGDDESYSLIAANGHITLTAKKPLGALRGMQTFLQLVQENTNAPGTTETANPGFSVPDVTIHDKPRFPWRGLSLDVSRHFIPVKEVERTIDAMAAVKLNVFHWHLSDDQGFRMQSKRYPLLTEDGSDGQFYTQAQASQVIAYAWARGVRVIPEFDMPGHATSWLVGYPSLGVTGGPYHILDRPGIHSSLIDPTKESTYKFLDNFIGEMVTIFPDKYFHIGGDEVNPREWLQSPHVRTFMKTHNLKNAGALQAYFNRRVQAILAKYHRHMIGWDEVLNPGLPKTVVIQSWRGQPSLWKAAREGYQGILSAGWYLDLMYPASYHYSIDPLKAPPPAPGHHLRPGALKPGTPANLTPEAEKRILGGEAAMWEELATAGNLDAKLWPRLAAIAERLWSPESITDTDSMYHRLDFVNRRLQFRGLTQRSHLELMRERLAGMHADPALDTFASVLEPVKGYSRHAQYYTSFTPLNRLVDSIPPESKAARLFRDAVDTYLAGPPSRRSGGEALSKQLARWDAAVQAVRPTLQTHSLLTEDIPVADSLADLCRIGEQAISYLEPDTTAKPGPKWKQKAEAAVKKDSKRHADMLIQIAPGIDKLVEAVPQAGK